MKILIDMNLSPDWINALAQAEIEAVHWSSVGNPRAEDKEIIDFAREKGFAIFTHDLDFGTILALTQAESPSVLQVRAQDVFPQNMAEPIIKVLRKYKNQIEQGALIVLDESSARVRILPLEKREK